MSVLSDVERDELLRTWHREGRVLTLAEMVRLTEQYIAQREAIARGEAERARKRAQRGTTESWSAIRRRIYKRDKGICQVCGRKTDRQIYQCGHIVDRMVGGSDLDDNLVVMCAVCNQWKPVRDTREQYEAWVAGGYWKREMEERLEDRQLADPVLFASFMRFAESPEGRAFVESMESHRNDAPALHQ